MLLTSLAFSARTNLVAGHPVTYLYMQSMCSAPFLGTINYMHKTQAWKPGGTLSSKLTITIILLGLKINYASKRMCYEMSFPALQ